MATLEWWEKKLREDPAFLQAEREVQEERIAELEAENTRLKALVKELTNALVFAEGAVEDAIYTEDGLDGEAGKGVLDMINPLIRTPEEMAIRAKEIASWPER